MHLIPVRNAIELHAAGVRDFSARHLPRVGDEFDIYVLSRALIAA